MLRPVRLSIALCAAALCSMPAVAAVSAAAATPLAHPAASCTPPTGTLKGGYFITKTHKGVSCATQKGLEAGFQACRLKHGLKGTCKSKILGFTCKEGKRDSIPTNFFATVTCKKGSASFGYVYEQDTL
jgi:hypothetical protein